VQEGWHSLSCASRLGPSVLKDPANPCPVLRDTTAPSWPTSSPSSALKGLSATPHTSQAHVLSPTGSALRESGTQWWTTGPALWASCSATTRTRSSVLLLATRVQEMQGREAPVPWTTTVQTPGVSPSSVLLLQLREVQWWKEAPPQHRSATWSAPNLDSSSWIAPPLVLLGPSAQPGAASTGSLLSRGSMLQVGQGSRSPAHPDCTCVQATRLPQYSVPRRGSSVLRSQWGSLCRAQTQARLAWMEKSFRAAGDLQMLRMQMLGSSPCCMMSTAQMEWCKGVLPTQSLHLLMRIPPHVHVYLPLQPTSSR